MRRFAATMRALPVTFVVYVIEACSALLLSMPLGLELLDDGRATLSHALGRAAWLDLLPSLMPALRVHGTSTLLHVGLLLLLAPWLQMAWLSALAQPMGVGRALAEGARLYLRAWLVTLWVVLLASLGSVPFLVAASVIERLLSEGDARVHDLLLSAACLPLLLVLWWAHVLHDLARARALTHGAWSSVRSSLGPALQPRVQLPGLLLAGLALATQAAVWALVGRRTLDPYLPALALLQLACLLGLFLRSLWLAHALACAEQIVTSRDDYD
jgi:hypothetical protein